jgi:putative alpha-1,2-mannosidase
MPESGALKLDERERASSFRRADESMEPSEYKVTLSDYGTDAQIGGTTRSGRMRFCFHQGGKAWILA